MTGAGHHHRDTLSPEVFDPPVFAAMCSPNVHVAAERIAVHNGCSARCV